MNACANAFLESLTVEDVFAALGLNPSEHSQIAVMTTGELRRVPRPALESVLGREKGRRLWHAARGHEDRAKPSLWTRCKQWMRGSRHCKVGDEVEGPAPRKITVGHAGSSRIRALLGYLSHQMDAELRNRRKLAGGAEVKIEYADGSGTQYSLRLSEPASGATLARAVLTLYEIEIPDTDHVQRIRVRALGVRAAAAKHSPAALEMVAAGV